jgi:hypothetical protein
MAAARKGVEWGRRLPEPRPPSAFASSSSSHTSAQHPNMSHEARRPSARGIRWAMYRAIRAPVAAGARRTAGQGPAAAADALTRRLTCSSERGCPAVAAPTSSPTAKPSIVTRVLGICARAGWGRREGAAVSVGAPDAAPWAAVAATQDVAARGECTRLGPRDNLASAQTRGHAHL